MTRLISWNVNGLRSIAKKDFIKDVKTLRADIVCLQETKTGNEQADSIFQLLPDYHYFINSSKLRKGYSGTALLSKTKPLTVTLDMGIHEHDQEGRVITAEFEQFFVTTVYAPNAGEHLKRLEYREKWDTDFRIYISGLLKKKPVIIGGDLNVAHREIDIARPKENYNKAPGYTQTEIDGFENLLNCGFTDSFRHFHPAQIKYTYWNQLYNARARNRGWRIDYFLVSASLMHSVKEAAIYDQYLGSDHRPIALETHNNT